MAYSPQSFEVTTFVTAAHMNQFETNIRDHAHGSLGVSGSNLVAHISDISSRNTSAVSANGDIASIEFSDVSPGDRVQVNARATVQNGGSAIAIILNVVASGTSNVTFYDNKSDIEDYEGIVAANAYRTRALAGMAKINSGGTLKLIFALTSGGLCSIAANDGQLQAVLFRMM